jgi:hypothetical protein
MAALALDAMYDSGPGTPARHELWDTLRRVLQICVHGDGSLTACMGKPGMQRCFLAEAAGEPEPLNARVTAMVLGDDGVGTVAGAVIHHDYLEVRGDGFEYLHYPL